MKRALTLLTIVAFTATAAVGQSLKDYLEKAVDEIPRPESPEDFLPIKHLSPISQDSTLICWSFSTSSLIESEMERLDLPPVRLSVIFPVYNVFIEKAKRYIKTRGSSRFSPGDLFSGVFDIIRQYGAVPAEVYGKKVQGETVYNHNELYRELHKLMDRVKSQRLWNEKNVIPQVKRILNRHLGKPPASFQWNGKSYTPHTFLNEVVALPWNDYITVTSFQYAPFYEYTELKVPDNWKRSTNFYNVPLDMFYNSLKDALQAGYSVAIDADISEPSYERTMRYGLIPNYDIPSEAITQEAREFRFNSGATTDDHLMHIVDYKAFDDEDWFLVKDSWRTAWEPGSTRGYMFFHSSYVKLKVLAYMVHKDGVGGIREKMGEK
jgi:bleomycin hydrolase